MKQPIEYGRIYLKPNGSIGITFTKAFHRLCLEEKLDYMLEMEYELGFKKSRTYDKVEGKWISEKERRKHFGELIKKLAKEGKEPWCEVLM
jgi:hypothetical protein